MKNGKTFLQRSKKIVFLKHAQKAGKILHLFGLWKGLFQLPMFVGWNKATKWMLCAALQSGKLWATGRKTANIGRKILRKISHTPKLGGKRFLFAFSCNILFSSFFPFDLSVSHFFQFIFWDVAFSLNIIGILIYTPPRVRPFRWRLLRTSYHITWPLRVSKSLKLICMSVNKFKTVLYQLKIGLEILKGVLKGLIES